MISSSYVALRTYNTECAKRLRKANMLYMDAVSVNKTCLSHLQKRILEDRLRRQKEKCEGVVRTCLIFRSNVISLNIIGRAVGKTKRALSRLSNSVRLVRLAYEELRSAHDDVTSRILAILESMDNCEFRKRVLSNPRVFSKLIDEFGDDDLVRVELSGTMVDSVSSGRMKLQFIQEAEDMPLWNDVAYGLITSYRGVV